MRKFFPTLLTLSAALVSLSAQACTGITLQSQNQETVTARSIEWGSSVLNTFFALPS